MLKRFLLSRALWLFIYIALLALFFAKVEIQIEGAAGWAANLPTWRVEQHWLLDIFWGGRPMTGYHAWVFSFMLLIFHLPAVIFSTWHWRLEARILGAVALFWIIEDVLWFLLNPSFGLSKFNPENIPWHKHWLGFIPTDYWTFSLAGLLLILLSYWRTSRK